MIGRANDVEYGLCASVWSENSGVTHRVAQAIDVSSQYTVVIVGSSLIQDSSSASFHALSALDLLPSLAVYSHALQCTPRCGSSFFFGKVTALGVLCFFALLFV